MSELNGDKARFQRLRKAGLRRRERARHARTAMQDAARRTPVNAILGELDAEPKVADPAGRQP